MILAADIENGVFELKRFDQVEGYKVEDPECFYESLIGNKSIVSQIKSLSQLKRIHKEFGISRY